MPTRTERSVELRANGLDQRAPVLEVVLDEGGELSRGEIDALEAVGTEELARLRQLQNLADIRVDLRHQLRRHVRRPKQCEPGGGGETRYAGLGDRRQIRTQHRPLVAGRGENPDLTGLLMLLDAAQVEQQH